MSETISVPYAPRVGQWDCAAALAGVRREGVLLSDAELAELEPFFWFDLCAEYDARFLHDRLQARADRFSPEFRVFEGAWWSDELNHYHGFRRLYRSLYDASDESIDARLAERRPDFEPIARFLTDEFGLCLLFAYDELATVRAYVRDFDLYERMGAAPLVPWIRRITRDESYHFQNAANLVRARFPDRLGEIPRHVESFRDFDLEDNPYRATFLFDHDVEYIERDFFSENARLLLEHFGLETASGA